MEQGAKLTDWVSTVNIQRNYLLVSTRLARLLDKFVLDESQFFPAPLHTPNSIAEYHLVYFPWPRQDDFIDWGESIFEGSDEDETRLIRYENSGKYLMQHTESTRMRNTMIFPEKITVDLFRFSNYNPGFYVSERLKNAMEAAGMTGIVYEVPEWLPK